MFNRKLLFVSFVFVIFVFFFFLRNVIDEEIIIKTQEDSVELEIFVEEEILFEEEVLEPIRFLFFGDLMLDRYVRELISRNGIDYIFSFLKEESFTEGYDFVFANLEGAVTDNGKHYLPEMLYDFAFEPQAIEALKEYNFNIFGLANNHLADQGQRGIRETYRNLHDLGFYYFGCRDAYLSSNEELVYFNYLEEPLSEDNCSLMITEVKGRKIAWLGFSIVYNSIDVERILDKIRIASSESDFLVVSTHWGLEYQGRANENQKSLAKKMVEAGANLIIGHHPHVIQDYEKYEDSYIFYSLGNFIFDQYFSLETQEGMVVSLELDGDGRVEKKLYKIKTKLSSIKEIVELE